MSLSIEFKGSKGRFASLNPFELRDVLQGFPGYTVVSNIIDKGHTKAAQKVGGGHLSLFTLRSIDPVILPTGDVVYPQIMLRDRSYPGGSLTLTFGLYRMVCSNGLFAFRNVATPVSIPHYRNRAQFLMELTRTIAASADKFAAIIAETGRLNSVAVLDPKLAIEAMTLPPKVKALAIERIEAGLVRPEDDINTAWGLYNFVNELDRVKARRNSLAYLDRDQSFHHAA